MDFDRRTEELIAIGAAVAANCSACLEHHLAEARKAGLGEHDIARAAGIGKAVRKGAAAQIDRIAAGLRPGEAARAAPAGPGCCG